MTDKEKIKTEIERRIKYQQKCIRNHFRLTGKPEEEIILEYKQLVYFINSLPEEPVSEDLKEAADNALESIADQYDIISVGSCLDMFKLGAKWQESKHGKELLYICNKTAEKTKREAIEKTLSWLEYYVDAEERKNYKEYMEE